LVLFFISIQDLEKNVGECSLSKKKSEEEKKIKQKIFWDTFGNYFHYISPQIFPNLRVNSLNIYFI
jgi:hypothetical protein